ncbi:hypothetical protein RB601_002831 [Gaeumannomyces tritici]
MSLFSFMIDGLDADDGYRMVEDEFLSVAGAFTAHLHKAEYHRLKTLTKNKNAVTIRAISRPVVGSKTEAVKQCQDAAELATRQKAGINRERGEIPSEDGDDDDDSDGLENPWAGTALQGLMTSARPKAVPLSSVIKGSAGTHPGQRRDVDHSSSSVGGSGTSGMQSRSLGAPSHTGSAVSSARGRDGGKLTDRLRPTDVESDEDLDAPSSFIPGRRNMPQCHVPVAASGPRLLADPLSIVSGPSRQTRNPRTAPSPRNMHGATGGLSTHVPARVPAHGAPRSWAASSPQKRGRADNGDGSDDDGILQRIRERRKSRMAQSKQETHKDKDEEKSAGQVRPSANQEGQGVTLDFIPSFL